MKPRSMARWLLFGSALAAVLLLLVPVRSSAFTTLGHTLSVDQRTFRVFNNFTDPSANDNTLADPSWPGATGAALAFWKAGSEWSSELHGDGSGDPTQPGDLGSGGANFDVRWAGLASGPGGTNDNTISELAGCGGGVISFVEWPLVDGWRMFFYSCWTYDDGPGAPIASAIDLQSVFTHEYGHILGLGHSDVPGSTMSASASGIEVRSIEADDQAGIQLLYGPQSAVKPHIDAVLSGSGASVTVVGRNFAPVNNDVRFLGGFVAGAPSSSGGSVLTVALPPGAAAGDVQVDNHVGSNGENVSNAYPFDPNACGIAASYCTAKPNSQGCSAAIASLGTPSASGPNPFLITASQVINNKTALLLYAHAPAAAPFQGGTLCLAPPIKRTPAQSSGGNPGPDDCSGTLALDFNARIQSGIDPGLTAGAHVYAQYYYRDPADPFAVGLSDALALSVCP